MNKDRAVPHYAIHKDGLIAGFFGPFSFLSNFYTCKNGICGEDQLRYPSVEHLYQAYKYPLEERKQFIEITAGKAKSLGKLAPNFNQRKWDKNKYEIMRQLVLQKFEGNLEFKEKLLLTDGYVLEERNNWGDVWWGTDEDGNGENNLGKILMGVREFIISKEKNNTW